MKIEYYSVLRKNNKAVKNVSCFRRRLVYCVLAQLVILIAAGCGQKNSSQQPALEQEHPLIKKAAARERSGAQKEAIRLLRKAIDKKPELGRAHLKIALLYDDYRNDYVKAIYHYQRYLELRAESDIKETINGRIRSAKIALCDQFTSSLTKNDFRYTRLAEENKRLQQELQAVRKNLSEILQSQTKPASPSRAEQISPTEEGRIGSSYSAATASNADAAAAASLQNVYEVKPKDTLSKIAEKIYGNSGEWKKIYKANRDILYGPDHLRVGDVLIIPE